MYNKIHPYALIIGLLAGIFVLVLLRHPLFAIFAGFSGGLITDVLLKRGQDQDPDAS